ncbi:thioredoxin domain-containing protein [Phycicoccus endophyticus]|uniref:Thioredoxin domain-containing protein n=1 Tax=Phycicoccus endophyticus TaxID=1690220 RepID=A0A7G9R4B6_9MICO|nr:thioredoxin domain-containing protein [Phycicoccus endophyticus]NHI18305.1 thioredoxin domain-containing protein [Phycicoccus endophyticus]QNN50441.1 thioredoxin domain-containing protein [Phycicoccus endophyticus]GGL24861.1 membrane protein [Phycicoccus endophyticus]
MAKNSTKGRAPAGTKGRTAANARQAKIQAAQRSSSGGANKIVVATVVVVVAIVAVVGGVIWMETSKKDAITGGGNALPAGVSALGDGYPAYQDVTPVDGAPTLEIYEDFQCPACKSYEDQLGSTVEDLAEQGKVRLVYHVKNFLDDNLGNTWSTQAGNAAFCAADAGKFQAFHDQAYANQPTEGDGFTDDQLAGFAEAAGITGSALDTWQECYDAGKYVDYVNSVEESSAKDGVTGTPTLRLNGETLDLGQVGTPEQLTAAIEDATA